MGVEIKKADEIKVEEESEDQNMEENEECEQEENEAEVDEEVVADAEAEGEGENEASPECTVEPEGGDEEDADETGEDDKDASKTFDLDELLKTKIEFKDDTDGYVFSRGPKYSEDKWPVNCHVCRLGNLLTKDDIKNHLRSRRHYSNVKRKWSDSETYNVPFIQCANKNLGLDTPIKIYPGESITEITPEYEERRVKAEEFAVKKPSEEIIKELTDEPMHDYNKKLPLIGLCYMYKMKGKNGLTYYCTLCNMKLKSEGFGHVVAPGHQYKYIERHFPKFYSRVVDRLRKERSVDMKRSIRDIFRKLYRKIENAKGFREVTIVDDDDFFKNRKRYLLKTRFDTHYDESTILITEQEVDILIRKCVNRMDFIKPDLNTLDKKSKDYEDRGRPPKRRLPPRLYKSMMEDDEEAWERYHYLMEREIDDLNQAYQRYDRFPKKHPSYYAEERIFLRAGKGRRNSRNLRRDWMPFWRRRLRQLYEKDLVKRKFRVKRELRLSSEVRTPSPIDTSRRGVPSRRTPPPSGYDRRYADHPDPRDSMMDSIASAPPEPLGVISVLRLLTALEDQLGSLGPKAVQLMSKAVLAEKSNQNPNDLMMENEVYVFFVTAKEKLKGQLLANIVEPAMIGAVNRAVADATTLLDMFEDYMRRTGKRPTATTTSSNQYVSSMSSNQYRSAQYTSDNNGTTNKYNVSGNGQFSGLSNQYQSGSGSGNLYTSGSGGSGMNQYSTGSGNNGNEYLSSGGSGGQFAGSNSYRGGPQGGIWQSGGADDSFPSFSVGSKSTGGYSSRNLSTQGGMGSRMY